MARAAQAPDAGQTLRELQSPPFPRPSESVPQVDTGAPPPAEAAGDVRLLIKSVRIVGNTAVETADLRSLVAHLEGSEHGLRELNEAASRITAYYRQQGYSLARAYVPAQDVVDGAVTIAVIEGRIDARRVDNRSRVSDERVEQYLDAIKPGDIVRAGELDRALLLLNDTPGIAGSRATLQPGASVGTTDLVVALAPAAPYSGNASFDTHGNRYTGESRVSGTVNFNSPFGVGDQITLNALRSNQDLAYDRFAYHRPFGSDGLRFGVAYAETRYRLGKEFTTLNAHGSASSWSGFAVYPFLRSVRASVLGIVSRERKSLSDSVDATATVTDKGVEVTSAGLTGNYQDGLGGGGITNFELTMATGRLNITSPVARAIDEVSARTRGVYTRMSYNVSRLQQLGQGNMAAVSLVGQFANKNLDSSEKFGAGGAYAVRAYPQGEGIGDSGYVASLELRHYYTISAYGAAFYDTGMVAINRYPFSTSSNTRYLSGVGFGFTAVVDDLQLRTALAWRTAGGAPVSVTPSAAKMPLFWIQAIKPF